MTRKVSHTILFLLIWGYCNAQYNYPKTKTVDSSDTYFGVTQTPPPTHPEGLILKQPRDTII
ncbi:MAG: hypothetical protein IPP60_04695 [Sphingobacteriales bacterium]|nr:hypothetical protein [Sphingobacteriales bacterium]